MTNTTLRSLAAGILILSSVAMLKDPFEGKWKVEAAPDGGGPGKAFSDVLTFKGGKMTAQVLSGKGWPPAEVDEDLRQGGVAQFKVTLQHQSEGKMLWQGSITASEMRGTILWTRPGKEDEHYSFNATKN